VALRYACAKPVKALVLLGFPVRPEGRARPEDEAALLAVRVPTLVVQGDADEKGPLPVLQPLVQRNRHVSLVVLPKTGHSFGRQERLAVEAVAAFLG
jgi:predicted alpha/beta-hydrolase family hydrolase